MKTYCFRAECELDVDELCMILGDKIKKIQKVIEYPSRDVEVEVVIDMHLEHLRNKMRIVPDGRVMVQTVAPKTSGFLLNLGTYAQGLRDKWFQFNPRQLNKSKLNQG